MNDRRQMLSYPLIVAIYDNTVGDDCKKKKKKAVVCYVFNYRANKIFLNHIFHMIMLMAAIN